MTKRIFLRWIKKFENTGIINTRYPGSAESRFNIDDLFEIFNTNTIDAGTPLPSYTHL